VIAAFAAFAAGGCARAPSGAPPLRIGSKAFTESVVLGEVVAALARGAGVPITERRGLGGTRLVWEALIAGDVDVYPDYTGTIEAEILRVPPEGEAARGDARAAVARLARRLGPLGVGVGGPLGFDNTYALGMREDELLFEIFGGDFIQRAGRHPRGGNAQFFRLGQNFFVLQAELFRYVVNTNGHKSLRAYFGLQPS